MVTYKYSFYAEVMKFFLMVMLLFLFPSATHACEGFKNSMDALEAAVQKPQPQQKSTLPHLQSLQRSLDQLEKAVADKSARVPKTNPPQNVTPRNIM